MRKLMVYLLFASSAMFFVSCSGEADKTDESGDTDAKKTEIADSDKTSETNTEIISPSSKSETKATEAFSYLKKLKIGTSGRLFLKYNPEKTTVINKGLNELAKGDPLYDENPMGRKILVETQVSPSKAYSVVYSPGPSADPTFRFYKFGSSEPAEFSVGALAVYIPSNGNVYTEGHTNNTFNERKKFSLKNGKFQEVEQAYYYVGLETKTLKPITLYASKNMTGKLASLPAGYGIEVVAHEKGTDLYLIKTDFGLLGWVKVESTYGDLTIEGLRYAGD